LLSGLAICGAAGRSGDGCGHRMTSGTLASGVLQYVCKECGRASRNMARVDDYIIRVVCERLSRPDANDLLMSTRTPDTAKLRNEITTLRARQDELANSFANGQINGNQMRTGTATLDAKIGDLESRILDANRVRVFEGAIATDPVQVRERFEAFDLDRRRAIVDALLTVTIHPGQPSHGKLRTDLLPIVWKC
jgi:site-specific DNA recombinase